MTGNYVLMKVVLKFISLKVFWSSCFKNHFGLQTGKVTFPLRSWGMERELEVHRCNHCLWRVDVLACLSVGLWLGNTAVLYHKMLMVFWLYKVRSDVLQYDSHAFWAMKDSVFRCCPVLTQCDFPSLYSFTSVLVPTSCCLDKGYTLFLISKEC